MWLVEEAVTSLPAAIRSELGLVTVRLHPNTVRSKIRKLLTLHLFFPLNQQSEYKVFSIG